MMIVPMRIARGPPGANLGERPKMTSSRCDRPQELANTYGRSIRTVDPRITLRSRELITVPPPPPWQAPEVGIAIS
jgi:hypothetical protein